MSPRSSGNTSNQKSPFPYLKDSPIQTVTQIHQIILSEKKVKARDEDIRKLLRQSCKCSQFGCKCLESYEEWLERNINVPPHEVMHTFSPEYNARLFTMIHKKDWKRISILLDFLKEKPDVKKIADEWLSVARNHDQMLKSRLSEAINTLTLWNEEQNLSENRTSGSSPAPVTSEHKTGGASNSRIHKNLPPTPTQPITTCSACGQPLISPLRRQASFHFQRTLTSPRASHPVNFPTLPQRKEVKNGPQTPPTAPETPRPARAAPAPSKVVFDNSVAKDFEAENILKVLLLGETGVGKTTFVNSFANYVKYESMDEALKDPIILIKTVFTHTFKVSETSEMEMKRIEINANCELGKKNAHNESSSVNGNSSTHEPIVHCIRWEDNGIPKLLQLIDTPGVNDTNGTHQDDVNFDKILDLIEKIGTLNAICILLKPNEKKLSTGFRNCLDSVLVKLHKDATENILFCFTNTRSTRYKPADTMEPLTAYLKEIEKSSGVSISPKGHNIFSFDNDCFRYMCITLQCPELVQYTGGHASFLKGWNHNVRECKNLLSKVKSLTPHQTKNTVCIDYAKRFLTGAAELLTNINTNCLKNMNKAMAQIEQIRECKKRNQYVGPMEPRRLTLRKISQTPPKTICTNPKCSDVMVVNDIVEFFPTRVCHDQYNDVQNSAPGESTTIVNTAMCKDCGCPFGSHITKSYRYDEVDKALGQDRLKTNKNDALKAEAILKLLENEMVELERERLFVRKTCAEISAFFKFNSLKSETDHCIVYMMKIIDQEKAMATHRDNNIFLSGMRALLKDYERDVSYTLSEMKEGRYPNLNMVPLQQKIEPLGKLSIYGYLFEELVNEFGPEKAIGPVHM